MFDGRVESAAPVRRHRPTGLVPSPPGGSHTHDGTGADSTVVGGVNETGPTAADASGDKAVAIGDSAIAIGLESTAVGWGALAEDDDATAVGVSAAARGSQSVAIGTAASTAFGSSQTTAVGGASEASGTGATAVGYNARAVATHAVAVGDASVADQSYAIALGRRARALHPGSVAIGAEIDTTADAQLAIPYLHIEMTEVTAPGAGAADSVRIYAVDNGAGKTKLMAQFATGAAQQLAIQP